MSKPSSPALPFILFASAAALAGCSSVSTSSSTISSRDGIYEIHQTIRKAPASDLAAIQALAAESSQAAAEVETHSTTQGDISH